MSLHALKLDISFRFNGRLLQTWQHCVIFVSFTSVAWIKFGGWDLHLFFFNVLPSIPSTSLHPSRPPISVLSVASITEHGANGAEVDSTEERRRASEERDAGHVSRETQGT